MDLCKSNIMKMEGVCLSSELTSISIVSMKQVSTVKIDKVFSNGKATVSQSPSSTIDRRKERLRNSQR